MIEIVILNHLIAELGSSVYAEVPEKPPESYVVIEKTGSSEENHLRSATFAIQSYAPSMLEAIKLNEKVKEAMTKSLELGCISSVKLNSDYNFTDTTKKLYRYQAVFDLIYYD